MTEKIAEKITIDVILNSLKEAVESKKAQFDAEFWISAATKINLLLGDDHDFLFQAEQEFMRKVDEYYKEMDKPSMARAKDRAKTTEEWLKYKQQEARVRRAEEFIKICKARARVAQGF